MPKRGHSEEEILRALREVEASSTGAAVCPKLGISEQTLYVCVGGPCQGEQVNK